MSRKRALIESDSSDDEDLEEQLLSLSKKKKGFLPKRQNSDTAEADVKDDDSDSSTDDGDDEWTLKSEGKGKTIKEKKKKNVSKKRTSTISSSEEEGEINEEEERPSDGEISGSSSDDGSDTELPAFDDGLDENLMGDEQDRKKLEQMTEKEREQELFNRMEKREALITRREIQNKLHAERKKEKMYKKKDKSHKQNDDMDKTESFSGTISARKEIRRKTVDDKKKSAMDELKQKRLEKKEKMDALIKKKEPLTTKDVYSDDDDDDDDDDDNDDNNDDDDDDDDKERANKEDSSSSSDSSDDEKSDKVADVDDEFIETINQLEQIRLSRHKLEKWVHLPFFSRVVSGCFIRMGIGQHDGRAVYRVAEIADVTETPKIYQLGKTRTNKGLRIRHGLQERVFRMEYISNQPFTDSEFQKWKEEMKLVELPLPTVRQVKRKSSEIADSKNYTYKEDDIEAIVKEKTKFRKNPHNYAVKKNDLLMVKALAVQSQDFNGLEKVNEQLADLEDRAVFLDKQRSGNLGNVSFINERNRKKNVYDAEKAVLEEAKQEKKMKGKDPFTRRRTYPTMITKGSAILEQQKAEREKEKEPPQPNAVETKEPTSEIDSLLFTPVLKKIENPNNISEDSDLFNIHNFDVQIDVPIPESRSLSLTPKPLVGQRDGISRRSLNLDEYKKRKGLM